MILSFDSEIPVPLGEECPVPREWERYVSPWSAASCHSYEFGLILDQELVLPGFSIFYWRMQTREQIRIFPKSPVPAIVFQLIIDGVSQNRLMGLDEIRLQKGDSELFYTPAGSGEIKPEPGIYESLHIEMNARYLHELLSFHSGIAELLVRQRESGDEAKRMAPARFKYITGSILRNLLNCSLTGGALMLEMHKYLLALLSEYLTDIGSSARAEAIPYSPHKETLLRIRNHILLKPSVINHTQKKLSREFGVSEWVLREQFALYFNKSVSRFVRFHALKHAQYLLLTTKYTIDDIADEVGYASRESFEEAFKNHYGYSPTRMRMDNNP